MTGAGTVKMWKRLVVCVGVLGYLLVVMVARNTMESGPHHHVHSPEGASNVLQRALVGRVIPVSQNGRIPWNDTLKATYQTQDSRSRDISKEGDLDHKHMDISVHGGREKAIAMSLGQIVLSKDPRIGLRQLREPDGFISQNNSLKPLYIRSKKSDSEGAYGQVVLVKRRYLSENSHSEILQKHDAGHGTINADLQGNDHSVSSMQRQLDKIRPTAVEENNVPNLTSLDLPTERTAKSLCSISDKRRRNSKVCRANTWAAECQASLLICQPQLCRLDDECTGTPPFLLVIIHSHPSHQYRRDAIRDTWGAIVRDYSQKKRVVFLFLLGSSTSRDQEHAVAREVALYRDIAQYKLRDTYNNLTVKSVLALDWIQVFCPNATYVLKTDDDAFMNISNILKFLDFAPRRGVLIGSMHAKSEVQRNGQWKVDRDVYPATTYPPYCSGTAYVITADVVRVLSDVHYGVIYRERVMVPMEDVYVTGILPKRAGLMCHNSKPFPNWTTGPSPRSVTRYLRGEVFGIHGLSHSGMYGLHKLATQCKRCSSNAATLRKWFALLTGAT